MTIIPAPLYDPARGRFVSPGIVRLMPLQAMPADVLNAIRLIADDDLARNILLTFYSWAGYEIPVDDLLHYAAYSPESGPAKAKLYRTLQKLADAKLIKPGKLGNGWYSLTDFGRRLLGDLISLK